ncbi:MAG TPA: autotransporter-associated beta strand repeat-containing protein, partial [Phycisphaerae bacterium]|nr:autotransporter-associated beta strand repeat-containing protein [Phycisphaerae bacterium]
GGGSLSLIQNNLGDTETLSGTNTYTGTTTINGGTLQIGNGGATGSLGSGGNVIDNAQLTFDLGTTATVSNLISGTGAVSQMGTGTTTLTAADIYTGTTTINSGTLTLGATGSIADSTLINVAGGATFNVSAVSGYTLGGSAAQQLEGSGNVTGNITIGSSGTLSPGIPSSNTIGALTVNGSVTLTSGSNISAQVTATSGVNDELIATGNVVLGNANGNISSVGALTNGETFTVIQGNVYGWFNSNGGELPALSAGLSWNTPLQINNNLPGAANTYQQNIVLSVTNGTPIYASNLPTNDTYAGFNISEHGGGRGTQVTFLGGTVTQATSLSVQFTAATGANPDLISDMVTVNGTNSDMYVLELSYNGASVTNGTLSPVLAVLNAGTHQFESAVLSNTGDAMHQEATGAYTAADFTLGNYGVDPTNDVVWAVLNYSAGDQFGIYQRIPGDLAGIGTVTLSDLGLVQTNLNQTTNGLWSGGDFQGTGLPGDTVTLGDLSLTQSNLNATEPTGSAYQNGNGLTTSSVPEPGSLVLLALGGMSLLLRQRQQRKSEN